MKTCLIFRLPAGTVPSFLHVKQMVKKGNYFDITKTICTLDWLKLYVFLLDIYRWI